MINHVQEKNSNNYQFTTKKAWPLQKSSQTLPWLTAEHPCKCATEASREKMGSQNWFNVIGMNWHECLQMFSIV